MENLLGVAGAFVLTACAEGDTPEILQKRIMEQAEWKLLPKAVSDFCDGKLTVVDGIVHHNEQNN